MILQPGYFADTAFWIALFRTRDQYHADAVLCQSYVGQSGGLIVTTEAVCWEWLNAISGTATRTLAAKAFKLMSRDPLIEIVPNSRELSEAAFSLFSARPDKDWSLTDCLSFIVMDRRNIRQTLTSDYHFEQAGFLPVLTNRPPAS